VIFPIFIHIFPWSLADHSLTWSLLQQGGHCLNAPGGGSGGGSSAPADGD